MQKNTIDAQIIRTVRLVGDTIDQALVDLCMRTLKPEAVSIANGMTECGGICEPLKEPFFSEDGTAAVGYLAPGSRAKVVKVGTNETSRHGEIGEVHLSSPCGITGYYDGRLAKLWYDEDGHRWFNTGDLGRITGDSVLFLTGRSKDVVVRKGINIFPPIIEGC
jgi:fatty-acyl-CoA synthase